MLVLHLTISISAIFSRSDMSWCILNDIVAGLCSVPRIIQLEHTEKILLTLAGFKPGTSQT